MFSNSERRGFTEELLARLHIGERTNEGRSLSKFVSCDSVKCLGFSIKGSRVSTLEGGV